VSENGSHKGLWPVFHGVLVNVRENVRWDSKSCTEVMVVGNLDDSIKNISSCEFQYIATCKKALADA
jgi:hypothetical protein